MRKILLFISLISFVACSKDSSKDQCMDQTLIRQIRLNNYDIQKVTYNKNCQVIESIEPIRYNNYIYNNQNQLIKIEEKMSLSSLSCYMPTGIDGESFTDPRKAKVTSYVIIEYNPDGFISKKSRYFNNGDSYKQVSYELYSYLNSKVAKIENYDINNKLVDYTIYNYNDKENVQSSDYYLITQEGAVLKQTFNYQYDNKLNPFRIFSFDGTPGLHTNLNNIVSEKSITYNKENKLEYTTTYNMEYNDRGYPFKVNDKSYIYGN